MVQSWDDVPVDDVIKPVAASLSATKRWSGLAYMSSKSEVTQIKEEFPGVEVGSFVVKAAQKAFTAVFEAESVDVI